MTNKVILLFNSLSANSTKWSNTLKQFVGILPTNFLSVFDHFVGLALKGLRVKKTLVRLSVLILSKLYASKCFCLILKPFPTNVFMLYPLKTYHETEANQWTGFYMITASVKKELRTFLWVRLKLKLTKMIFSTKINKYYLLVFIRLIDDWQPWKNQKQSPRVVL